MVFNCKKTREILCLIIFKESGICPDRITTSIHPVSARLSFKDQRGSRSQSQLRHHKSFLDMYEELGSDLLQSFPLTHEDSHYVFLLTTHKHWRRPSSPNASTCEAPLLMLWCWVHVWKQALGEHAIPCRTTLGKLGSQPVMSVLTTATMPRCTITGLQPEISAFYALTASACSSIRLNVHITFVHCHKIRASSKQSRMSCDCLTVCMSM